MGNYSTLIKLLYPLQVLRAIFHILLFETSPVKSVIEKDIEKWIEELNYTDYEERPRWRALVWLLWRKNEFRNLFYYRIARERRLFRRILLEIIILFFLPKKDLYLKADEIGEGFFIQHGYSTGIAAQRIGKNCWVNQEVTIGYMDDSNPPIIGDNVRIAVGARVLGDITIGDNSLIGANSVVIKDVPPNCTVVGVPGYIVKRDGKRVREEL